MTREHSGSLFFLLVGLYALFHSLRLPMGSVAQPGAGVFPLILSILLSFVGVFLLVSAGRKEKVEKIYFKSLGQLYHDKPVQIVALTAAYIAVFEWLGYLLVSLGYLFLLFYSCGNLRMRTALVLSLALTFSSWYFFAHILGLQFPRGLLSL